jgi:hypothetical protein
VSGGDVGQALAVAATASNSGGSGAAALSGHTAVVSATSSLSLIVFPGAPMTNQTVTMVATISSSSGNANPSGSLTFFDGDRALGGCPQNAFQSSGQSVTLICQSSFPAGIRRLSAVYAPAAGMLVAGSASQLTLGVGRDSTSVALAVTKQVSRSRRAVYSATVVLPASNSGPIQPSGSVEFLDRGRPIAGCLKRPLRRLTASCAVRYRALGRHEISALYNGDPNFAASHSASRLVRIVRTSSGPAVLGFVGSVLQWQFVYHPRYTRVTMLRANGLVRGMTLALGCTGGGCPFTRLSIPAGTSSLNLLPKFDGRHLRVGAQVTLSMMRRHWVGKYYTFTVQAGRAPQISVSCLGVGRSRPGVGC